MYLFLPFLIIWNMFNIFCVMEVQNNALNIPRGKVLSGEKCGAVSEDWDTTELKETAKKYGTSFNEFTMALLSVSLKRFYEKKNKPERQIRLGMPASFRKVAKTAEKLDIGNDVSVFFVDLVLHSEIK